MAEADDDTETQTAPAPAPAPSGGLPPDVLTRLIQQLTTQQPAPPTGTPDDGTKPSWTGLLGSVLGGGQAPGYQLRGGQADTSGNRALLNFGINTLLASGPHAVRPDVLSAVATGLQGAQESLGLDQQRAGAQAATAFEQNRQQQQDKLARIKEAIPLLTMQQNLRAVANSPTTLGGKTPGGGIATGGSLGSVDVPPEYLPFYQEASARTGIPAEILIAQGRQESGFNPGATGAAGEIGIGQINPKTATDPGYGMTGLKNPTVLRDPRTNINFQADYLAARAKAAGADFSTPEGIAKALKAYNGGGDPNYVQNVTRYIPGARTALAPPASGRPNAAPGQPPTPPPTQARPVLPLPEAPLAPGAGGALVAGPGGPTSGTIPPSPPGSGADVADIVSGMVARGADPTTLAPGPGSAPAPAGAAVAGPAGPAGPTAPVPGSYEEYRLLHPITPSADDLTGFRTTPDPSILAEMTAQQARAQQQYGLARSKGDLAGMQKAESDFNTVATKMTELRQNAVKLGTDTRAKFMADQDKQRYDAWAKEQADARQQAQKQQEQQAALALEAARGDEARKTGAAASENSYVLDERKRFGLERDAARTNIDDLQMLTALSNAAGTSTPLENIRVGDKSGRDFMVQWGLGTEAAQKQWGAQQAFEAAVNKTVTGLRQGMSMGQLSDRDMAFIQHMAPNLLQHPQTRADIIAYLEQAQYRKLQYTDAVEQLWDGGKGMSWGQAKREAQKQQPDYVPKVPDEYTGWDAPTRKAWLQSNARPGQLMRGPDGRLSIYQPPQQGGQ